MRRLKNALLVLLTLLLVAVGAVMPEAVSYIQDSYSPGLEESRSFDSFSLTLREETDLGRTLQLIAGSDYYVEEAQASEHTSLSEGQALDAAQEVLTELVRHGLLEWLPEELSTPDVWPQTLVSEDGADAIPMWSVSWHNSPEYIWLDDAAGKAVMITVSCPSYSSKYVFNVDSEPIFAQAENWRLFLEDYYGAEVQITDEEWFDKAVRFTLTFPLGEEQEQTDFQLDLYIYFADGFTTLSPYVSPVDVSLSASASSYDS